MRLPLRLIPLLLLSSALRSQTPAPAPAATPTEAAPERTIYIPYEKLWTVFEKEGRGVFVPYEEFNRLWTAARSNVNTRVATPSPVGAVLKEAGGLLRVGREVVEAEATVRVELLTPGWHEIPLGLGDVGLTRAEVDGQTARVVTRDGGAPALLVEHRGDAPRDVTLSLGFARAYERTPGRNRFSFQPPPAAVSRWEVVIPEPGVKAVVSPLLATSTAAGSTNETRLVAVVGAAPQVSIEWTPRAEGAVGLDALVNVRTESDTELDEGVTRTRLTLTYTISRAKLGGVVFDVPAGQKVVAVTDANVKEWKIEPVAQGQRVRVDFFEPAGGEQKVTVELEAYGAAGEVAVPLARAQGVSRQQGAMGVRVSPRLRAEPLRRVGVRQVDQTVLTRPAEGVTYPFAYQYNQAEGAELVFRVEPVTARVQAESVNQVRVEPDRITQELRLSWEIERAGVFKLQARLPEGFEVEAVQGVEAAGAAAPRLESHFVEDGVLTLNLAAQAIGRATVRVALVRRLNDPRLQQPASGDVTLDIPLPRASEAGLERQKGLVELTENPSLQRLSVEARGLDVKGAGEARAEAGWVQAVSGRPLQGGWFFRGHEPSSLRVTLRRRAPYIAATQVLEAAVESGRVQYRSTFLFDVSYSGVRSLRIDVPEALAARIKLGNGALRMRPASAEEAATPPGRAGCARLVLEGDKEFLGRVPVVLEWSDKIGELAVGQSVDLPIPRLEPAGTDHAWGQIVLKKAEALDLMPGGTPEGLRPIDPERDLAEGRRIPGATQAYEFRTPAWSLTVRATRYEVAEVKVTSVERGWIRQVLTRSGQASVQAVFRLRSARQRLALRLPEPAEFDTQPARINGSPVALERGPGGEYFVPLTGRSSDEPLVLELRYTRPVASSRLEVPSFVGEPAVQKVYHSVYLPPDQRYLGYAGPWTEENIWMLNGSRVSKRANRRPEALLEWVTEGVAFDHEALARFATDGTHLLYAALRPTEGPAGALRVRSMTGWIFDALVLAALLAGGVPLLRATPRRALLVAASACCVWTVTMVFLPSFAGAMVGQASAAAVVVLVALYVVRLLISGDLLRWLPRRKPATPPSPPPPEPPAPPTPAAEPTPTVQPES